MAATSKSHKAWKRFRRAPPPVAPSGVQTRRSVKGVSFSGLDAGFTTLSRRVPYAMHMHEAWTSQFVGSVTRRVRHGPEPPPLLKRWPAGLVHWAQATGQRFRVGGNGRRQGLSGLFLGAYSPPRTLPHARRRRA